ncbi:MAG: S9 family peptidase, partial [Thermoproteota archaeon]|nr:S9 family peptidase [Thermoproteota archaeon]
MSFNLFAQDAIEYKTPPKEIYDLVTAKPTPTVSIDSKGNWMLISERSSMPTVEDLAQPELRIAGLRINPNNFGPSRLAYIINFTLKNIKSGVEFPITGLPTNLKAGNIKWNPDENKIGFINSASKNIDLYVIDIATKKATKWNKINVNTVMGNNYDWMDNNTILYSGINKPYSLAPIKPLAPKGPVVQQNLGKVAASRTYQDLIKNPYDEELFEFYGTSQLIKNVNGTETKIGSPAIYSDIN